MEIPESILRIKGDNIIENMGVFDEIAATSNFWTLVDEKLGSERIGLEFISEDTDFSTLPEKDRVLYKFRLTGAPVGEAIKTIWAPKDMSLKDLKILVMRKYRLNLKLHSVNFYINERAIATNYKIADYSITPESTLDDITVRAGAITVMTTFSAEGDLNKHQSYIDFKKSVAAIFGRGDQVFKNIFSTLSYSVDNYEEILNFIDKFNDIVKVLMNLKGGLSKICDIVPQKWKHIFDNHFKYIEKNGEKVKVTEIDEDVLDSYWKIFMSKISRKHRKSFEDAMENTYKLVVMSKMLEMIGSSKWGTEHISKKNPREIFNDLNEILINPAKIIELKNFQDDIFEEFAQQESFALFFSQANNLFIHSSLSTKSVRVGSLSELDVFLNYLPGVLRKFYKDNNIDPSTSFHFFTVFDFNNGRENIFEGPLIRIENTKRYSDFGVWEFTYISEGNQISEIKVFPIKFDDESKKGRNRESLIDGISSLFAKFRENLNKPLNERMLKSLRAEIHILNRRHLITTDFKSFSRDILDFLFGYSWQGRFIEGLDVYSCHDSSKKMKVSNLDVLEQIAVIKTVNEKIWKRYQYQQITSDLYRDMLKLLIDEIDNTNWVKEDIIDKNSHLFRPTRAQFDIEDYKGIIKEFLINLLGLNKFSKITFNYKRDSDNIIQDFFGLDRCTNFDYYYTSHKKISEFSISQLKTLFETIYVFDETGVLFDARIGPNTPLDRAFRIVHRIDSDGVIHYALVEVSYNNKIENPREWVDGVIVSHNGLVKEVKNSIEVKIFKNALLTDYSGKLLSSFYFDTDMEINGQFRLRNSETFKNNLIENFIISDYSLQLLFVISESENNKQMNTLIDLNIINPFFIDGTGHYELPDYRDLMAGINRDLLVSQRSQLDDAIDTQDITSFEDLSERSNIDDRDFFHFYERLFESEGEITLSNIWSIFSEMNIYIDKNGRIVVDSGREKSDIEGIINELFSTVDEMKNFFFRDRNGNADRDYSLKQWMSMLYLKIINYDGNNKLIQEAKDRIIDPITHGVKIDPLDVASHPREFTYKEIKNGIALFKTISNLFGHVTVRFILMQMMEFRIGSGNKFKIEVSQRKSWSEMTRLLKKFDIVASSQRYSDENEALPLGSPKNRVFKPHLYTLFFGDSFLYLPIVDSNQRDNNNRVSFGISPFIFNSRGFELYISRKDTKESFLKSFIRSGFALEQFITKKIKIDPRKGIDKEQLIQRVHFEIFSIYTYITEKKIGTIRKQIEDFIDIKNEDYFIDVIFHTENYRLRLTIEDFLEYKDFIDIGIFGDISKNYDPNDIEKILNTLNS